MKAKGLGTGLGALFGDAAIESAVSDFEYVQIHRVEPRQEQPRTVFEQDKIDELADSIREHGIISPLTVRKIDNGYYQIIAGERRWRAARDAGLTEVPVRVVDADDRKALELALVENLQREDLNPIEEAQAYKTLLDDFDMTQEQVAQRIGKSRPAVANAMRLLALPSELIKLIGSGELSAGSARALLGIKDEDQITEAAQIAVKNNLSVREVEALVKNLNKEKPEQKIASMVEVDYIAEAQKQLSSALGRKVAIKQGKGKGKIEIEYYDNDDFNELYDALTSKVQTPL